MSGGTIAIVPVKRLAAAKSRLAGTLTAAERAELVLGCFDRVLGALQTSGRVNRCLVVTGEAAIHERARRAGADPVDEVASGAGSPRDHHNQAIETARQVGLAWAPESLLVVSADLPLLRPEDVRALIARSGTTPGIVIAPDRHGRGTNALLLRPPDAIRFQFGVDSYARHRQTAEAAGLPVQVYDAPGTAFDVDVPEDLDAWNRWPEPSRAGVKG
ncbi:MAG TPA: 2-phospho-L-lactate guanylyltransferase [Chloroflexota bacterium]|nr:2-phospho-L-lactate guanylyltransferase [Chloroflexota bacterium]